MTYISSDFRGSLSWHRSNSENSLQVPTGHTTRHCGDFDGGEEVRGKNRGTHSTRPTESIAKMAVSTAGIYWMRLAKTVCVLIIMDIVWYQYGQTYHTCLWHHMPKAKQINSKIQKMEKGNPQKNSVHQRHFENAAYRLTRIFGHTWFSITSLTSRYWSLPSSLLKASSGEGKLLKAPLSSSRMQKKRTVKSMFVKLQQLRWLL